MEPSSRELANVRRALRRLRAEPVGWRSVETGGYTPARRWIVTLDDDRTVFVKAATDELTASWLRDEHMTYSILRGAPFMPAYHGFTDDGERPVLVLEDLSAAAWPPPWDRAMVDAVIDALARVAATPAPEGTALAADGARDLGGGWDEIARDPSPFLALGLCDPAWLGAHLEELRAAARDAPFGGDAFLHFDVRSDNTCIHQGRAVFVDWNMTTVGNRQLDLVFWLPSLEAEGGPRPEAVLPDADPRLVAVCAGFFASRAGLPPVPSAPLVRHIQLTQARAALPWAARALEIAEPRPVG
jgi:hypothetical protein